MVYDTTNNEIIDGKSGDENITDYHDDHDLNGTQERPISLINDDCLTSNHGGFMVNRSLTLDQDDSLAYLSS